MNRNNSNPQEEVKQLKLKLRRARGKLRQAKQSKITLAAPQVLTTPRKGVQSVQTADKAANDAKSLSRLTRVAIEIVRDNLDDLLNNTKAV